MRSFLPYRSAIELFAVPYSSEAVGASEPLPSTPTVGLGCQTRVHRPFTFLDRPSLRMCEKSSVHLQVIDVRVFMYVDAGVSGSWCDRFRPNHTTSPVFELELSPARHCPAKKNWQNESTPTS